MKLQLCSLDSRQSFCERSRTVIKADLKVIPARSTGLTLDLVCRTLWLLCKAGREAFFFSPHGGALSHINGPCKAGPSQVFSRILVIKRKQACTKGLDCRGIFSSLVFSTNHTFVLSFFFIPHSLINADFCCAGSLIAYGALLGKVSPVQLMVVTLFGVTLFAVEEYIILSLLHVSLTKPSRTCRSFYCCPVAENCP